MRKTPARPYPFYCPHPVECTGVFFQTERELGTHLMEKHRTEADKADDFRDYVCPECKYPCVSKRALTAHVRFAHHGGQKAMTASLKARGLAMLTPRMELKLAKRKLGQLIYQTEQLRRKIARLERKSIA